MQIDLSSSNTIIVIKPKVDQDLKYSHQLRIYLERDRIPDAGLEADLSEPPLPIRTLVLVRLRGRLDPAGDEQSMFKFI